MNRKICLYLSPYNDTSSYFEMIDLAYKNGIGNMELLNQYELSSPDYDVSRQLKSYADSKDITITCVSACIDLVGNNRKENIESAKKYVDIASLFGSPCFHHTVAPEIANPQIIINNAEEYFQNGIDATREIFDYAESKGIRTVCEDQGYLFNGKDNFGRFLREVDRNIGVIADFGNIMFAEETIDAFITEFGDRIVNVHVKDFLLMKNDGRTLSEAGADYFTRSGNYLINCPLGKGNVNLQDSFERIREIGYRGTFSLECPPVGHDEESTFKCNLSLLEEYLSMYMNG